MAQTEDPNVDTKEQSSEQDVDEQHGFYRIAKRPMDDSSDEDIEIVTTITQHETITTTEIVGTNAQRTYESKEDISVNVPESSLGIIRLDYKYPAAIGDAACPTSFKYKVIYSEVKGLTFEMCQKGELPDEVKANFENAIKQLVDKGVSGISGDCGFMMWYQKFARSLTKLPVFMSALCQLPAITCSFGKNEKIAIFTANGVNMEPMEDLIEEECGVHIFDKRYIIVGCQDVHGFEAVQNGEWVDRETVMKGIVQRANGLIKEHNDIRAILFECTELPQFSNAVRVATGLPVYDVVTACNFFMSGVQPSTFGVGACNPADIPSIE